MNTPTKSKPGLLRAGASLTTPSDGPSLGPLTDLIGTWMGSGFSLIALPDFQVAPFRLRVNATKESFHFVPISAPIPDRGSVQPDITYKGLTYLQNVADATTNEALHVETGMLLNVPATTDPAAPASVVRQASIPHGNSLLAQGQSLQVTRPQISPVSPLPTGPGVDANYTAPYSKGTFPPGFDINNPNAALQAVIEGQDIVSTVVLRFSTSSSGGILNIPFINANANATQLDSIFWLENVQQPTGATFLQLQYTQTVILDFEGIQWPHITLATLLKQ
jgi:hypothetical protein